MWKLFSLGCDDLSAPLCPCFISLSRPLSYFSLSLPSRPVLILSPSGLRFSPYLSLPISLCFPSFILSSASLSFCLTLPSSSLSLPPRLRVCPWEQLSVCKLLAWLQQYLKLCHKSCCQTNTPALGQPGSVVFLSFSFFFLALLGAL